MLLLLLLMLLLLLLLLLLLWLLCGGGFPDGEVTAPDVGDSAWGRVEIRTNTGKRDPRHEFLLRPFNLGWFARLRVNTCVRVCVMAIRSWRLLLAAADGSCGRLFVLAG
ncbi:unnamed protein product [Polarella glacialis]|uniref:Secreted protein n=1 Tax=Polarella glacialis TaxID=89957 RepID=A0A813GG95_POLGL|nr:unnamed protein product [Polarella glacialis]